MPRPTKASLSFTHESPPQSLHSTFLDKFVSALVSQPRAREGRLDEYTEVRCLAYPGLGLPSLPMLLSRWNQRAVRGK